MRNKWFVNLSSREIPKEVRGLLQLRDGFCLPTISKKDKVITEFIIENNLWKIQKKRPDVSLNIRNHSLPIIQNLLHHNYLRNNIDKDILQALTITKNFIRDNNDILFTRADKGNITVALDKLTYFNKMKGILKDVNTYTIVKRNPINSITTDLHSLLTRWRDREFITFFNI